MASVAEVDVVMATDLRFPGGTTASVVEEVRAQNRYGYSTGLLHMESPMHRRKTGFADRIRHVIDREDAALLLESNVKAKVLLIRHPSVLENLDTTELPNIDVDHVVVIVNQVPLDHRTKTPYYNVAQCDQNAQRWTGKTPLWAPIGPQVRKALEPYRDVVQLHSDDWTNIVDLDGWYLERHGLLADRPILGRHSRGHWSKWPATKEDVLEIYPDDFNYDVRILGGTEAPEALIGHLPRNWKSYPFNSVDPQDFLHSIDFLVYYHHPKLVEAFGRTVLEGIAAGAVAVVDPEFKETFGDACVYAKPAEVRTTIDYFTQSPDEYAAQSRRGAQYAHAHFSYETHHQRLARLIGEHSPRVPIAETTQPEGSWQDVQEQGNEALIVSSSDDDVVQALRTVDFLLSTSKNHPEKFVVLVPQQHAKAFVNRNVLVETFSPAWESLNLAEQRRYIRARILQTLREYRSSQLILAADTETVAGVTETVVRTFTQVLSGDSDATCAISKVSESQVDLKGQLQKTTQRLRQYTIENAPGAVIKTATGVKHGLRRAKLSSMRALTPHATFFAKDSDIPLLKPRSRRALYEAPTVLFIIEDQKLDPIGSVKNALERALSSGAFNPVFLAPIEWLPAAEAYGATIETFEDRQISDGYRNSRIEMTVAAYQPVNTLRLTLQQEEPRAALLRLLDTAEVVAAQRYV